MGKIKVRVYDEDDISDVAYLLQKLRRKLVEFETDVTRALDTVKRGGKRREEAE